MTNLIIRYRLKADVTAADFEHWVSTVDHPLGRALHRVQRFDTYRITGMLMGGEKPCDYIEIFEITDFPGFLSEDMPGSTIQSIMGQFMGFADAPEFMIAEVIDAA